MFLAVVVAFFGYLTVSAGQKATLLSLISQGKALTTVLISSANNIIETERITTEAAIDRLAAEYRLIMAGQTSEEKAIKDLAAKLDLVRILLLNNDLETIESLDDASPTISDDLDSLQNKFLSKLKVDEPYSIAYEPIAIGNMKYLLALLPMRPNRHWLMIKQWNTGISREGTLTLPYLLNQLSSQAGVEYIVLQNYDGIVFASKKVSQMDRIEADPFLKKALESDTAVSRLLPFEDRQVLEIVQRFESGERFQGLFRVGLSMYGYRQLALSFKRQVWLSLIMLLILIALAISFTAGRQLLSRTRYTLDRTSAISSSLHDSIAGVVLSVDKNFKITSANAKARELFSLPTIDYGSGCSYLDYFKDDPFKVSQVINGGKQVSFETHLNMGDKPVSMIVSTSPIKDGNGQITGAIAIAQDISEKQISQRKEEHSRRLMELGSLAAGLAHDIRNPLNAIGLAVQRMKREISVEKGRAEFEQFISAMERQINELGQIVEKILSVARTSQIEKKMTNLKTVLVELASLYGHEAAEKNIKIITDIDDFELPLDLPAFQSMIANLIKNSIDAIERNGTIKIMAEKNNNENGLPVARITIEDNGRGMSEEQLHNIFRPFYTTKPGGTGIGLAAAYKIARDHGGDLKASSKIGGPTIFTITIPL